MCNHLKVRPRAMTCQPRHPLQSEVHLVVVVSVVVERLPPSLHQLRVSTKTRSSTTKIHQVRTLHHLHLHTHVQL